MSCSRATIFFLFDSLHIEEEYKEARRFPKIVCIQWKVGLYIYEIIMRRIMQRR